MTEESRLFGLLLGTAVGDAVGLPREGLGPRRAERLFGGSPLAHRLILGRGLVSDDTEHACLVAEALLEAPDDPDAFGRALARRFRLWLAALPAGVGLATLRSGVKLWAGFGHRRSGVYSAGNGPAMRAPLLGAFFADDAERLRVFLRVSTRLTHTDHRAVEGAWIVARATSLAVRGEAPGAMASRLRGEASDPEMARLLGVIESAHGDGVSCADFAARIGVGTGGVTGYIYQTVPVALYCWWRAAMDFRNAVEAAILLGGDTDTVAAITGALAGAAAGADAIPREWVDGLWGRPTVAGLERLAGDLVRRRHGENVPPPPSWSAWPAQAAKNAVLLPLVLGHGLRRLLPPY
jgi:ADP-ribosyl-[dinitrogen reductase] hydrolase